MGGKGSGRSPATVAGERKRAIMEERRGATEEEVAARRAARSATYRAERKASLGIPNRVPAERRRCNCCGEEHPLYEFPKDRTKPGGRGYFCAECKRASEKLWRRTPAGRAARAGSKGLGKARKALAVRSYKARSGCLRCGERFPDALDLHHLDPAAKEFSLSELIGADASLDRIMAEVEKCAVLCANCHRKLHAGLWRFDSRGCPQEDRREVSAEMGRRRAWARENPDLLW